MEPTFVLCDVCGEQVDRENRLNLDEQQPEPSYTRVHQIDLCDEHMADYARDLLRRNRLSFTVELMQYIRDHQGS